MIRTVMRPLPGDEEPPARRRGEREDLARRLWPKVAGPWFEGIDDDGRPYAVGADDCWLWRPRTIAGEWRIRNGRRVRHVGGGYGRIRISGREGLIGAHVAAFLVTFGPFPAGEVIAHSCDVRLCCNPAHLRAVPQALNVREAFEKGRLRLPREYAQEAV